MSFGEAKKPVLHLIVNLILVWQRVKAPLATLAEVDVITKRRLTELELQGKL